MRPSSQLPNRQELARSLWIVGEGACELRRESLPATDRDTVRLQTLFGAISRGTEALVFSGRVPESEYERMRGPHQAGDFPFPVKYGYAQVATVVEGPPELQGCTVFCLHPHQDRCVVDAQAVIPLPETLPPERAVLAANMETALNILWDTGAAPGDRIAVVGGGLVGLLVAYLAARLPGCEVTVVDIEPARRDVALFLGAGFALPQEAQGECDVVVHASATAQGLATAVELAGFEARIVEASWFGEGEVALALGGAFHSRRLSLVASQVGHVPAGLRGRWSLRRRLGTALALLADERLDRLITGETPFAELPAAYASILSDATTLCHRIRYTPF